MKGGDNDTITALLYFSDCLKLVKFIVMNNVYFYAHAPIKRQEMRNNMNGTVKKVLLLLVISATFFLAACNGGTPAEIPASPNIDDENPVEVIEPVAAAVERLTTRFPNQEFAVIDGVTLVPIRSVFEGLGFSVDWNADTQRITLTDDSNTVVLTMGYTVFTTNGTSHFLDLPVQSIGGGAMVPIRPVLDSLGLYVGWDNSAGAMIVSNEFIQNADAEPPRDLGTVAVPDEEQNADQLAQELIGIWFYHNGGWGYEFLPGGAGFNHILGDRHDISWEIHDSVLFVTNYWRNRIIDYNFNISGDELHLNNLLDHVTTVLVRVDSVPQFAPPPPAADVFVFNVHDAPGLYNIGGWWKGTYMSGAGVRDIYMLVGITGGEMWVHSYLINGGQIAGHYAYTMRFNLTQGRFETVNSQWQDGRTGVLAEKYLWLSGDSLTGHMNPRADGSSRAEFWYNFERIWWDPPWWEPFYW